MSRETNRGEELTSVLIVSHLEKLSSWDPAFESGTTRNKAPTSGIPCLSYQTFRVYLFKWDPEILSSHVKNTVLFFIKYSGVETKICFLPIPLNASAFVWRQRIDQICKKIHLLWDVWRVNNFWWTEQIPFLNRKLIVEKFCIVMNMNKFWLIKICNYILYPWVPQFIKILKIAFSKRKTLQTGSRHL